MKNIIYLVLITVLLSTWSCQEEEFTDNYPDPSKIDKTTVERQYTGMLVAGKDYVVPAYWNYFVVARVTLNPWTQSIGWWNDPNQYIPGSSGVGSVWDNYYGILSQYREFQKVWNTMTPEAQADREIFNLTANVYLYNETQRMVDLFGNIPFTKAGMLSTNGGDYNVSFAEYDNAEDIYTFMLDELKSIAGELNSINLTQGFQASFGTQDIINNGDVDLWKRYTNSLRLRMLTRVSASPDFASRSTAEIGEILSNPTQYPVVENNDQNIMIDVYDVGTPINSSGLRSGINSDGWTGDDAGKVMMDLMNTSSDPRLRVMFDPGDNANGEYVGLDPLGKGSDQQALVNGGMIAYYDHSTYSENQYVPGVLINAAEVSFLKAEYYLKNGSDAEAKDAYENGIKQSIDFYYYVRSISNDASSGNPEPPTDTETNDFLASDPVSWDKASSTEDKMTLIGTQRWVHFNILQPYQNWAEVRRTNIPDLTFWVDNSSIQTTPPPKFGVPDNEIIYNPENYAKVKDEAGFDKKVFWDMN